MRITSSDRGLVVYKTKKDIRCNLVLNGFKSSNQASVFFPSEEEAKKFLKRNDHDINGWVVNDSAIHKAKLMISDKTFVKVKSINGDVYIQEKYAATLGVPVNSQTLIPA